MAQPGTQIADGSSARPALEELRDHVCSARACECFGIAKERRDRNQEIAEQRLGLVGIVAHDSRNSRSRSSVARDLHAPRDAPQHGRALVLREIVTGADAQMGENASQQLLVDAPMSGADAEALMRMSSTRRRGESRTGSTKSATSVAIALRGIEAYSASLGSCTRMMPPASLTALTPMAPSEPAPVRMMAKPSPRLFGQRAEKQVYRARDGRAAPRTPPHTPGGRSAAVVDRAE